VRRNFSVCSENLPDNEKCQDGNPENINNEICKKETLHEWNQPLISMFYI
jgi:hypothetical protein